MASNHTPTRVDVAILALFLLGGDTKAVDTERIASKCFELYPDLFCWRTRRDQINLELVRVALSDSKKARFGWVEGTGRTGWSLTPRGRSRAASHANGEFGTLCVPSSTKGAGWVVDDGRRHRERERIHGTAAWRSWHRGDRTVPSRKADEVFRIDSYSSARTRSLNINRLRKLFSDQENMLEFLDAMAILVDREAS